MAGKRGRPRKIHAENIEGKTTYEDTLLKPASMEFMETIKTQREMVARGVTPSTISEDQTDKALKTETDQGLGGGDGLDKIARRLSFPLPEDRRTVLNRQDLPGESIENMEDPADAWHAAAKTSPSKLIPVGSIQDQPLVRESGQTISGTIRNLSKDEKSEIETNLRENQSIYDKSLFEENAKGIDTSEAAMATGLIFDPDPISRILGLKGYMVNHTWEWLRVPEVNNEGQQLSVTRYYYQCPPLKCPLAIDIIPGPVNAYTDQEIKIKGTLLPAHGIVYWALKPGEHITKSMRDAIMQLNGNSLEKSA